MQFDFFCLANPPILCHGSKIDLRLRGLKNDFKQYKLAIFAASFRTSLPFAITQVERMGAGFFFATINGSFFAGPFVLWLEIKKWQADLAIDLPFYLLGLFLHRNQSGATMYAL